MGLLRKLFGGVPEDPEPSRELAPVSGRTSVGPDDVDDLHRSDDLEWIMHDHRKGREAFERVQAAEVAAATGDHRRAERLFREALDLDRRARDQGGTGYVHGRYGAYLETGGRPDDAIRVYEEAVRLGTDIPAIYGPLMGLYAGRGGEDDLFRTADLYAQQPRIERARVLEHLVRLAVGRARAGDAATAERWLLRAEGWAVRGGDQAGRFAAWGQRGLVVERAGEPGRAAGIYEAAVAAGSTDRTTYTRLLMAYEQAKRWADALALARRALGVQHDAAWEEDLRKRIARIEAKRTPAGGTRTAAKPTIPAFSVRRGADRVELLAQLAPRLPPSRLALAPDGRRLLVSAGSSKPDNLSLYDLRTNEPVWTVSAPASSADVLAVGPDRFVAGTDQGRVGDGSAQLTWFDAAGRVQATAELPDKLSEVRAAGDLLVAGCRDGHLYAFDRGGRPRWRFRVPERGDLPADQPYIRACPYFVRLSPEGERVLFSSWDTVFMLDDRGQLRWTWTTPTEPRRFHFTVPLDARVPGEHYYRVLGLPATASADDVRKAFRRRALETHPDRNPDDPRASDRFREAVQAYEAILSGAAGIGAALGSFTIEVAVTGPPTTIYGLAVAPRGEVSLVTGSDGALTSLDASGRPLRRLVASEGAGHLAATADLSRVVYAHWGGLNFYRPQGLVGVYPADRLNDLRLAPDGQHVAAWSGKALALLTTDGGLVAELEFARTVADAAFLGGGELIVAAGKLVRLGFG